ncbi:S1/P1 nuclease [Hygrophoropsis aurantiaca]|uniref:S1/P1 nuclease n=1 Tax=Hygrophoropsis aurantiaca TaxID=72124 RepID=A0ACB7ZTJ6_9AGAM|nr:S1/P1 nuclease [Hygrophoropsis aurantiaca]
MRALSFALAARSLLHAVPQASAWGAAGHEIVATIAQIHLHPSVLPTLCSILQLNSVSDSIDSDSSDNIHVDSTTAPRCSLATIATWADRIRYLPQFRWTAPLHYIGAKDDYPSATCAFPGSKGWEKEAINVLRGIRNTTGLLGEWVEMRGLHGAAVSDDENDRAREALKFLIHFLGDMHMPLHLTGRDRGGNGDKVSFDGRVTNLHSLWDSLLIAQRLRTLPSNYTRPLPLPDIERHLRGTIYDPYIRRLVWEGLLGRWEDEIEDWVGCSSTVESLGSVQNQWMGISLSTGMRFRDGGLGTDDDVLCPYEWALPIHALNCEIVWPKQLDEPPYGSHSRLASHVSASNLNSNGRPRNSYLELDTPEYAGRIKDEWIIERLLTQGGIRLAAILNTIFLEDGEEAEVVRLG